MTNKINLIVNGVERTFDALSGETLSSPMDEGVEIL